MPASKYKLQKIKVTFYYWLLAFTCCMAVSCKKNVEEPVVTGAAELLQQVNILRASGCRCGTDSMPPVPALQWNDTLRQAAQLFAKDMYTRGYFAHISPEGTSPVQRAIQLGYTGQYVGENIAKGYNNATAVMEAWKKSDDHCHAMMNSLYTEMGAGRYQTYWVQEFGKP